MLLLDDRCVGVRCRVRLSSQVSKDAMWSCIACAKDFLGVLGDLLGSQARCAMDLVCQTPIAYCFM